MNALQYMQKELRETKGIGKNIFKSVSVEFECIDTIYEFNIISWNIKDADGDFLFIERLKKEIIIIDASDYWMMRHRKDFIERARECLQRIRRDELYRL